jgi:phenylalanyl-tRNA synthetase beta chain
LFVAAVPGEKMTTLDGEERELSPEMLVIADAERAVAIGGIKGGEDSGISETTVDVLLEAACVHASADPADLEGARA